MPEVAINVIRLAKAVGVEVRLTPHMFRHTTATLLRKNGMDVHDIQENTS